MTLRQTDASSPLSMSRPLDRTQVESALFHLLSLSSKFLNRRGGNFETYDHLLLQAERLLCSSGPSNEWDGASSPVVGPPLAFCRLVLKVMRLFHPGRKADPGILLQLKSDMSYWETAAFDFDENEQNYPRLQVPASLAPFIRVTIFATSLMLDWISQVQVVPADFKYLDLSSGGSTSSPRWQLVRALEILRHPNFNEYVTGCYIGVWPIAMLGHAVVEERDVETIDHSLQLLYQFLGLGDIPRILGDLEIVWRDRRKIRRAEQEAIRFQKRQVEEPRWRCSRRDFQFIS